jgi:uncharacterized membrane protein YsdA (DUF1294 family)/cold shock CspA family protein
MRLRGKITSWNDGQGFGFIAPDGGGDRIFVHIKAFASRQRRPVGNENVTYELAVDRKGRVCAHNVIVPGRRPRMPSSSRATGSPSMIFAALFAVFICGSVITGKLPLAVAAYYLVASAVTFIVYAWDKSAARNGQWRTAENTLHLFALVGGWPGAMMAQRLLRHKSGKQSFRAVFWATVFLNCGMLGWLLSATGANALRSLLDRAI